MIQLLGDVLASKMSFLEMQTASFLGIYSAQKHIKLISHIRCRNLFKNTSPKRLEVVHAEVVPAIRASAATILAIMRLSSGLMIAPSRPLAIAMVMKVRFMNWRAGRP